MTQKSNVLAMRLTLWFVLLSVFPILVLILFIQPNLTHMMVRVYEQDLEQKMVYSAQHIVSHDYQIDPSNELSILFGKDAQFYILDHHQILIFHPQAEQIGKPVSDLPSADLVLSALQSAESCTMDLGAETVICSQPIAGSQQTLVLEQDVGALITQLNQVHRASIIQICISLLVMALAAGGIIWLLIGKPIQILTLTAQRIGDGDFSQPISTESMSDEMEVLGKTFNHMSEQINSLIQNQQDRIFQLASMKNEVEKSQENLLTFFHSVSDYIFVIGEDERIRYANHAVDLQLGYTLEELVGADINKIFIRNYSSVDTAPLTIQLQRGNILEGYLLSKQGRILDVEMKLSHGLWSGEQVIYGTARDVSERIRAEKEIRKQMQRLESMHRVDQTITGTLDLSIILKVLLSQLNVQLDVQGSTILLYDALRNRLSFIAEQGFNATDSLHQSIQIGDELAGQAALNRKKMIHERVTFPSDPDRMPPFLAGKTFQTVYDIPLIAKGELKGVLELYSANAPEYDPDWNSFLEALTTQAALAIDNTTLFQDLQKTNTDLYLAYDITLEGWVKTLELRDLESYEHCERTMDMTMELIKQFSFRDSMLPHIHRGSLLHDIGKLAIPDQILNKPGPLDEQEWEIVRQHPKIAHDLLVKIPFLQPALTIPYSHHERWDGSGYPLGIAGEDIPLEARIFAIVDVWDALTHDCAYRSAWPKEDALAYIKENAGKHFDPQVVEVFLHFIQNYRNQYMVS